MVCFDQHTTYQVRRSNMKTHGAEGSTSSSGLSARGEGTVCSTSRVVQSHNDSDPSRCVA